MITDAELEKIADRLVNALMAAQSDPTVWASGEVKDKSTKKEMDFDRQDHKGRGEGDLDDDITGGCGS